ncbi:hypothetical protein ACHAXN_013472 [Cyclotella atomus]
MSSRLTSPFPSTDAKSETGTLSNDALYAPLSTYNGTSSQTKSCHSLTIQTSTSLRESSLLAFLSQTSSHLKTSNPYESQIYKSVCGSFTKYGMGDTDHGGEIHKSFYEHKLSNRSLVLVGGGVHSHADRGSDNAAVTSMVQAAGAGRRRVRRRVGGNGMFGSFSGRKRKKIIRNSSSKCELSAQSDGVVSNDGAANEDQVIALSSSAAPAAAAAAGIQSKENEVIETMHKMWTDYIIELLRHIKPEVSPSAEKKAKTKESTNQSITTQTKRQIASLLIEAEHAGMAVTIVKCPSRRDLMHHRGVVMNETKNTYNIAILMSKRRTTEKTGPSDDKTANESKKANLPSRTWKVVMIPKRGTVLETNVPFQSALNRNATHVSIRLET